MWRKSISFLSHNRNGRAHEENALVERKKDGTALVIGAIPPNLKLLPSNRKHFILLAFDIFLLLPKTSETVVEQYNRSLADWERQVKEKHRPPKLPERESVRNGIRQLQEQGRQQRTRKKSQDRER